MCPEGSESDDWDACSRTSECEIAPTGCCASCTLPTVANVDAVNRDRRDQHFRDVCPSPTACPLCATVENPELLATCRASRCEKIDVAQEDFSICATDSDCTLVARECCACGSLDVNDVVAINASQGSAYTSVICDRDSACDACVPTFPSNAVALCGTYHHCEARYTR